MTRLVILKSLAWKINEKKEKAVKARPLLLIDTRHPNEKNSSSHFQCRQKKWCSNIKESCTCHLRAPTSFKCLHLHYTCQQVCICAFTLIPFICFSLKFGSYRFNYFKSIKFHLISPNWATNVFQKINGAQWLISDILSITYHYLFKKKDT